MTHVKQRKLLKDGIDSFGEPVRASKWVNGYMSTKGMFMGEEIYEIEEEAVVGMKEWHKQIAELMAEDNCPIDIIGPDGTVDYEYPTDHLFIVQLPVRS